MYTEFVAEEDIPVHKDIATKIFPRQKWGSESKPGGRGAIRQFSRLREADMHIHEIPPEENLNYLSHLYEETAYAVSGNKAANICTDDGTQTFE